MKISINLCTLVCLAAVHASADQTVGSNLGSGYGGGSTAGACKPYQKGQKNASTYGNHDGFAGKKTANGKTMNPGMMTAASKTLPFGTIVRVINQKNGQMVSVCINDRGPFVKGRDIDLSPAAARKIDSRDLASVAIEVCSKNADQSCKQRSK